MTELRAKFTFTADSGQVTRALKEMDSGLSGVRAQTQSTASTTRELGVAGQAAASGLNIGAGAASNLGRSSETAARGIRQQSEASREAAKAIDLQTRAANTGIAAMARMGRMAATAGAGIAAAFSTAVVARTVDGWSDMQSRIGAAIKDQAAAPGLMQDMLRLANASYSGIGQTVDTFAGNVTSMRDLGYAIKETVDYTESLNHMLVITATKGERAAAVQNALSKAMATGKMDANGLETVLASGGRVAEALAKRLGTTVSNLRGLASQGKITGKVIAEALLGSLEEVRREAGEMPTTIADGFLKIGNSVTALVGSIDKSLGASEAAAGWLNGIAEGIGKLAQSDFGGIAASMADGARTLGEIMLVLAATRIPMLIGSIASLNITTAIMTGQLTAGAIASRGIAAAMAAQAVAARGLAAAMALAGGPAGIVTAGVVGLGVALWNTRSRAEEVAEALGLISVAQRDLDAATEEFYRNRNEQTLAAMRQAALDNVAGIREALALAEKELENASFQTNFFGNSLWETSRMADARAAVEELRLALFDAEGRLQAGEHAASNLRHELGAAAEAAVTLTDEQQRALATAEDMLRAYERRAELALAEAEYGRESIAYQVQQLAHERELLAARVASLDISEELRLSILGAADAAMQAEGATAGWDMVMDTLLTTAQDTYRTLQDIAATEPPGSWLEGAIGQAQRLATALWEGLGAAGALAGEDVPKPDTPARPPRRPAGARPSRRASERAGGGASRGGGVDRAAQEAEQQRKAVADLTASLQQELDILRELDPALQELIRHRDVLAHATEAEKRGIEEMIRTRIAEADVLEEVKRRTREVHDLGRETIGGIFDMMRQGASAGDILIGVLDRIAGKIGQIAQDNLADLIFGGGQGGAGGGGLGGIIGSVFGALRGVKPNALGDVIGSPTLFAYGDRPGQLGVMGEAGAEAIMPLTHAMGGGVGARIGGQEVTLSLTRLASGKLGVVVPPSLAGSVTPFAAGAAFGPPPRPPLRGSGDAPAAAGSHRIHMSFDLRGAEGDVAIERKIARAMGAAQAEMQRMLPQQVQVILADPRVRR